MNENILSLVLLEKDVDLSADAMRSSIKKLWPEMPEPTSLTVNEKGFITLDIAGQSFVIANMQAPIPDPELGDDPQLCYFKPEDKPQIKRHQSHLFVTVVPGLEPIPLAVMLTKITAAVLDACPTSIGAVWPASGVVCCKQVFIEMAKILLEGSYPLVLWIGTLIGMVSNTHSQGYTIGLRSLGFREFETKQAPLPPDELRDMLLNYSEYLLTSGRMIRNGDTIGASMSEQIRIIYGNSSFGLDCEVMILDFGGKSGKKPWWKFGRS